MTTWLGPTVGVHQVRRATYDVLQAWLPVAVVDVARQSDIDPERVELPASWHRATDYRQLPIEASPNVVVASPQTASRSIRADGSVNVAWIMHAAAFVRGTTFEHTADLVGIYLAAITSVIEQHLAGHPLISSVAIPDDGEQYDVLTQESGRSVAGGVLRFEVTVDGARQTAPPAQIPALTPPEDPLAAPPDAGVVTDAYADIEVRR